MSKSKIACLLLGASLLLGACSTIPRPGPVGNKSVPEPAKPVVLDKYLGTWYEQFRYEASFQKDMDYVNAVYSLNPDGTIKVLNSGRKGGDGKLKNATGKAKIVDTTTNAKLKVSFFGPFYGNYWILDHGDNYEWSIVGEPSGRYLWVLTRDQHPNEQFLSTLQRRVQELGYDWSLVRKTKQ